MTGSNDCHKKGYLIQCSVIIICLSVLLGCSGGVKTIGRTPERNALVQEDGTQKHDNKCLIYDLLIDRIYLQKQGEDGLDVDMWTDQKEYALGDPIIIYVRPERDCFLYLLDIKSSGTVELLFPNPLQKDNLVKGGRTSAIPTDFKGFAIDVSGPAGTERIKAIASRKPLSLFEETTPKRYDSYVSLMGILKGLESLPPSSWGQGSTEFRIMPQGEKEKMKKRGIEGIRPPDKPQEPIDIIGTTGVKDKKIIGMGDKDLETDN